MTKEKRVSILLPPDQHIRLKILAAQQQTSITGLVQNAIKSAGLLSQSPMNKGSAAHV